MFIELVDVLRCPRPHEESWLVLSASRMRDRHVVEGELGCHVCQSHFSIRDGIAVFDASARRADAAPPPASDAAFRMAALLGLAEPGGIAVLVGEHTALAPTLAAVIPETQFLCINAAHAEYGAADARISQLLASEPLPVSAGSCRGVAVDAAHASPAFLDAAIRVLRGKGRLVVPATATLPDGVVELARDSSFVVAERAAPSGPLVALQGARRK